MPVWIGDKDFIDLEVSKPVKVLAPAYSQSQFEAVILSKSPITAPIQKGDVLGELVINVPRSDDINQFKKLSFPLVATENVGEGGLISRSRAAVMTISSFLFGSKN